VQLVVRGEEAREGQGRSRGGREGREAEPAEEPRGRAGGCRVAAVAQRRRRGDHPGLDPTQGRLLREAREGTVELSVRFPRPLISVGFHD
jgi:hypothetical protein